MYLELLEKEKSHVKFSVVAGFFRNVCFQIEDWIYCDQFTLHLYERKLSIGAGFD